MPTLRSNDHFIELRSKVASLIAESDLKVIRGSLYVCVCVYGVSVCVLGNQKLTEERDRCRSSYILNRPTEADTWSLIEELFIVWLQNCNAFITSSVKPYYDAESAAERRRFRTLCGRFKMYRHKTNKETLSLLCLVHKLNPD